MIISELFHIFSINGAHGEKVLNRRVCQLFQTDTYTTITPMSLNVISFSSVVINCLTLDNKIVCLRKTGAMDIRLLSW